jgi:hypothetical protein
MEPVVNDWYKDAMTEEQLQEIADKWLTVCGSCDYGLPHDCNCPRWGQATDPRHPIARLLQEIGRLKEIEDRMKGLEK